MRAPTPRPAIPAQFREFYKALADIARKQQIERREHCRVIVDTADEIAREGPPPPQFRPGVEMIGGYTWIDESAGGVQ